MDIGDIGRMWFLNIYIFLTLLLLLLALVRSEIEIAVWSTTNAPKECWSSAASDVAGSFMVAVASFNGPIYLSYDFGKN